MFHQYLWWNTVTDDILQIYQKRLAGHYYYSVLIHAVYLLIRLVYLYFILLFNTAHGRSRRLIAYNMIYLLKSSYKLSIKLKDEMLSLKMSL